MTDYLKDSDAAAASRPDGAWKGVIAAPPVDLNQRLMVIVPAIDPEQRIGPCRWQPRDEVSLPARGDHCLVIFDGDHGEPWVAVWWPFTT